VKIQERSSGIVAEGAANHRRFLTRSKLTAPNASQPAVDLSAEQAGIGRVVTPKMPEVRPNWLTKGGRRVGKH